MTKDTEFGMVSWEQAFQGVTNGVPGLTTDQFELVPIDPDEDWYGVRVPASTCGSCSERPASTPGRASAGCSAAGGP